MKKKWFIKNLITFALPIFAVLLMCGVITLYFVYHVFLRELNKNNENLLSQIQTNVETILNEVNSLSLNFEFYTKEQDYGEYSDSNTVTPEKRAVDFEMLNFMNTIANSRQYIHSIYLQIDNPEDSFMVSNNGRQMPEQFLDSKWLEDAGALRKMDETTWTRYRGIKRYSFESPTDVITVYRKLYTGLKQVGTVALNIYGSYFDERLSALNLLEGQEIEIYSKDGEAVYNFTYHKDNGEGKSFQYRYITVKSEGNGYTYISRVPTGKLYEVLYQISLRIAVIFLISIAAALGASYVASKRSYDRIYTIYQIIEAADSPYPLPELTSKAKDEYGYIIQNMIKMFIESRYVKAQLAEKKSRYEAMELLALQSQINPHFLFNTIETINWSIIGHLGFEYHASRMLEHLSDVLKFSLSNPNEKVMLKEELSYTKSYLAIMQERYRDRFDVIWEVDDSLLDFYIIKMIIQPLVENSIYHGIKEKAGMCKLKIRLYCLGEKICLEVIDTGMGMSKERLLEVRQMMNYDNRKNLGIYIGVKNVYKRLKLVYEETCSMTIRSKEGLGTSVKVVLPADMDLVIKNFSNDIISDDGIDFDYYSDMELSDSSEFAQKSNRAPMGRKEVK